MFTFLQIQTELSETCKFLEINKEAQLKFTLEQATKTHRGSRGIAVPWPTGGVEI
jgi:hypothetical protein